MNVSTMQTFAAEADYETYSLSGRHRCPLSLRSESEEPPAAPAKNKEWIMQEKRRSIRYVPGQDISIAMRCGNHEFSGPLSDLSSGGLMTLLAEKEVGRLPPGTHLCGEITTIDAQIAWDGLVVHHTPTTRGVAVGIATRGHTAPAMRRAAEWLAQESHAGALQLRRSGNGIVLDVVGRLSFEMSRDFLHLVRNGSIVQVDLSRCTSLDSAGLGMLSIARERRLEISGARDMVRTLLSVAQITGDTRT